VPVRAGDVHHLPSGTCHALGAGVMVAEVQTPSDTTFRLWDWGREGRKLHIDQALECILMEERGDAGRGRGYGKATVVKTGFYELSELYAQGDTDDVVRPAAERPAVWMVLDGEGKITLDGPGKIEVRLRKGMTVVLPAMVRGARVEWERDAHVLEVSFPG